MGRRTVLPKFQVFASEDTTADPESSVSDVSGVDYITYEIDIGASVDADIEVQFCNDARISDSSAFRALNFNQTTPLDGSSDTSGMIHVENQGFKWMRLAVSNNGGTGNISAWLSGTVRGA